MIRITSKRAGFRRCGMPHPKEPVDYSDDRFSKKELEILEAETMLIVEIMPDEPEEETEPEPEPEIKTELEPTPEPEPEIAPEKVITINDMTVAQLKGELDALGIDNPDKARKAELFEIYERAQVKLSEE